MNVNLKILRYVHKVWGSHRKKNIEREISKLLRIEETEIKLVVTILMFELKAFSNFNFHSISTKLLVNFFTKRVDTLK